MGIYDKEDIKHLYLYCRKCKYRGQIIDVFPNASDIVCPSCGQKIEQVSILASDSCQDGL